MEPIRVLVVDDHPVVRSGLSAFLLASDDFELAGEAASGDEAIRLSRQLRPDVVLMDLVMPGMDGVAATRAIRASFPDVRVVALTSFDDGQLVHGALAAGAAGYLLKNVSAEELSSAILAAVAGRQVLSPEASRALMDPDAPPTAPPTPTLTPKDAHREPTPAMTMVTCD